MACDKCAAASGPFCSSCGDLLPLPAGISPFAVFGLPEKFTVDAAALEARRLELSRALHPDRFVRAASGEKRRALEWTTALNDAFRLLQSPEERADFLLKRRGVDLSSETGEAAMRRLSPEFLEAVLEEREALFEAEADDNHEAAEELAEKIRARMSENRQRLISAFAQLEAHPSDEARDEAASCLAHLRYDARFLEEADRFEMESLD